MNRWSNKKLRKYKDYKWNKNNTIWKNKKKPGFLKVDQNNAVIKDQNMNVQFVISNFLNNYYKNLQWKMFNKQLIKNLIQSND